MSEVHIVEISHLAEGDIVAWRGMPSEVRSMQDAGTAATVMENKVKLTLLVNCEHENNCQTQTFTIARDEKIRLLRPVVIDQE